jgi:hypothetical protein
LLGKHAKKPQPVKGSLQGPGSTLVDRTAKAPVDVDSDDEGGRTAAFTSRNQRAKPTKKRKAPEATEEAQFEDDSEDEYTQMKGSASRPAAPTPSKRKASSYLDELLAEKSKKQKKKKQK